MKDALNSVEIDADLISEMMEAYLKEVVAERVDMLDIGNRIKQTLDRKIEVSVKMVVARLETEIVRVATESIRKRTLEKVSSYPIDVIVKLGSP